MPRKPAERPTKTCQACPKTFKQYRANQLFCSHACRNKHHNARRPPLAVAADDRTHLTKIAEMVGEADDIGATWESVVAIIYDHNILRDTLARLVEGSITAEMAREVLADIDPIKEPLL